MIYGYFQNDPINFIDPWGLDGESTYSPTDPGTGLTLIGVIPLVIGEAIQGGAAAIQGIGAAWRWLAPFTPVIPQAQNTRLQGVINELIRITDKIPGGTAGALRCEKLTGDPVGGKSHLLKAIERARQLERILEQENLNPQDRALAERLLNELRSAISM